jgi:hypothetical protein
MTEHDEGKAPAPKLGMFELWTVKGVIVWMPILADMTVSEENKPEIFDRTDRLRVTRF